jgi:formate dehydrogenase subunit delta
MSKSTIERLVHMANQIATNLAMEPDPASATRDHIRQFWDPRMKQMIVANGDAGLSPVAATAIAGLGAAAA